ncbi:UNVERIFIED_CONTAM: hypothetical protein Slati_3441400 [Sesamum latifolium]|uniref:Gag-pol polyprotein n=1 Tax=Sesamum latifolium TaxID=2727402 RepID=A0AAW2UFJ2_9LAMI
MDSGMAPANITANVNTIPIQNGSNFKSWKENLEIVLGEGIPLLYSTSEEKREKERWEKYNRMCVMTMKKSNPEDSEAQCLKH